MTTTVIESGNFRYVDSTFTATSHDPSAASTAVTFTLTLPDGSIVTASNGAAAVTGPVAGSAAGLTTTMWSWQTPVFTQVGRYQLDAVSTAGLNAAHRIQLFVR